MKIRLSIPDVDRVIGRLRVLRADIPIATMDAIEKIVEEGTSYATALNASAPQSGLEKSSVEGDVSKGTRSGYVALVGRNSVYDEFGTGERGAESPHPMHGQFGLNPYNSGSIVSRTIDKNGKHYWRYSPMAGTPYVYSNGITYGIPAGKVMYNTSNHLRKVANNIVKETFESTLAKFDN